MRVKMPHPIFILWCFFVNVNGLPFKYHTNKELELALRNFVENSDELRTRLYKIGESVTNVPLWVVEITATDENAPGIPNIKFVGNIHGNEAVGREILLQFLQYLRNNYKIDDDVTWLLKNAKIHVLPTLNPDGFSIAPMKCRGEYGRLNINGEDLNRDFPDYYLRNMDKEVQPETRAVMSWMKNTSFVLSAVLHSGAMVANYPFDTVQRILTHNNDRPSPTPDDDVFRQLALVYSFTHPTMHTGVKCEGGDYNKVFKHGITNGAQWYSFPGSMSDYNYWKGCMEVTLEISCCKYPPVSELPQLWEENKRAMIKYSLEALKGVTGKILDDFLYLPIAGAALRIIGRDVSFTSNKDGEFWRLLLPGNYTLQVEADGYHSTSKDFEVFHNLECFKLTNLTIYLTNSSVSTQFAFSSTVEPILEVTFDENDTNHFSTEDEDLEANITIGELVVNSVAPLRIYKTFLIVMLIFKLNARIE